VSQYAGYVRVCPLRAEVDRAIPEPFIPHEELFMPSLERKRFDDPDETRAFQDKGRVEILNIGGGVVGRAIFEPGWKWSDHVRPIAGTDSCQAAHVGYVVSGRQTIRMDDGTELEIGPGDVVSIPAGHDGWTVGNEACVVLDFAGMADYAKQ
jgi:quercetin dioxygenase-like cupin family protein